ncbi:MAG: hypothetical protein KFB94_09260 [Methylophilaceae bacterium]|nr:MAG: hypothetical protein KFB94_09260 [Methylophilaceae bacterium]
MASSLQKARNTKSTRLWFLVLLLVIVVALYMTGIIKKGFAIGLGILLLAAIGIQTFDYDLDLGTLWETGSIKESRVQQTKDGVVLKGDCVRPAGKSKEFDLNCSNFSTQAKYDYCAEQIANNNQGLDRAKIINLDVYGLDGNKNGIVCEALP